MLKIDTHAHYLPRNWPDLAAKYGDIRFPVIHHGEDGRSRIYKDGKFFREIWPKTWDPKIRIEEFAGFGVQVQVISTVPVMFSYWAKPQHAHDLHQALNDHMAETCREHPRHYAGIGTVPLQSPRLAVQELERCMDQLGLQGVQIGSHVQVSPDVHWNLDAPELFPFFEAAADLGAAILVHPWDMMGTATMYCMAWSRSAGLCSGPFLSMMRMQASCVRMVIFLMSASVLPAAFSLSWICMATSTAVCE